MADNQLNRRDDNILITSLLNGVVAVPTYLAALGHMTPSQVKIATCLFSAGILGSGLSNFTGSCIKGKPLLRCFQDALWAISTFFFGGFVPMVIGCIIPNRLARVLSLIALTAVIIALFLTVDFLRKKQNQSGPNACNYWIVGVVTILVGGVIVVCADLANHLRKT